MISEDQINKLAADGWLLEWRRRTPKDKWHAYNEGVRPICGSSIVVHRDEGESTALAPFHDRICQSCVRVFHKLKREDRANAQDP